MISNSSMARLAGVLYLIVIVAGVFAEVFVRSKLIIPLNASTTLANIMSYQSLFRMGFLSDMVMITAFFLLAMVLYIILKPVNKNIALLFLMFVVISVSIMSVNMLNHFAGLLLINNHDFQRSFSVFQQQTIIMFFLNMHRHGYYIAQVFFGLWLFPLGFLIYRSGVFPKIIGAFLMIGCLSYLCDFLLFFAFPNSVSIIHLITIPADIAEFSLCLWLLVMGAKNYQKKLEFSYIQ